jgi:hypothetical protein
MCFIAVSAGWRNPGLPFLAPEEAPSFAPCVTLPFPLGMRPIRGAGPD